MSNQGDKTVEVIDTASHRVLKAIPVGTNPHFLVLGPDGRIWGTNTGGTDIYVIDPGTQDKIASINVGPSPQQIAFGFKGLQGPNAYVTVAGLNRVVVLSADRPPANAMDVGLLGELVEAVERLAQEVPRALVLTGRPGFFSAGADLKAVPGYGPEQQRAMITGINRMALGVYDLPCPVVGAITGHAIAGGLVLALCTDVRVASSEGRYGLTEVKVGVPYPQAAIGVVAAELAPHSARALALGNQLIGADECLRLGVFDELAEPEVTIDRAVAAAAGLAAVPARSFELTKLELRRPYLEAIRQRSAVVDPDVDAAWKSDAALKAIDLYVEGLRSRR